MISTGIIGFILLIIAYLILVTKFSKYFIHIDILATISLVIYSISIHDIIFILINIFILIMLTIKLIKGGIK